MNPAYKHHWLKVSNRIYSSRSLRELSAEEKWVFIGVLCLCSQHTSATVRYSPEDLAWELRMPIKTINSCLEKLQRNATVAVLRHNCDSREEKSREEENIAQKAPSPPAPVFDFSVLYEKYPRKLGKKRGLSALKTRVRKKEEYDSLTDAVLNYSRWCKEQRLETRFVKHFSTFAGCWEDWVEYPPEEKHKEILQERDV